MKIEFKLLLIIVYGCLLTTSTAQMSKLDGVTIHDFKPIGDPTATLGDLQLWVCGGFYLKTPTIVKSNKPIADLHLLKIKGGTLWDIGRTHEFVVIADSTNDIHDVILEYKDKRYKQGIKFIPDPNVKIKLGGQDASAGMASIAAAKTNNLLEFVGDYGFNDPMECFPKLPEIMVEGQVELTFRGATKDRIEFGPSKSVDIKQLMERATPGSQLVVTQFNCLVAEDVVVYRSSPSYTMVVLIN